MIVHIEGLDRLKAMGLSNEGAELLRDEVVEEMAEVEKNMLLLIDDIVIYAEWLDTAISAQVYVPIYDNREKAH